MGNDWQMEEHSQNGVAKTTEYAVLVGVITQQQTEEQVNEYLDELEFLALTAGAATLEESISELQRDWRNDVEGFGNLMNKHLPVYRNLTASYQAKK